MSIGNEPWGPNVKQTAKRKIHKKIFVRISYRNVNINDVNHNFDTQIQGCTNEDPRICGLDIPQVPLGSGW